MRHFILLFFVCLSLGVVSSSVQAEKDYYLASPEQIARIIDSSKGERRVVFLYASWCGYCRAVLPRLIELEEERKGSVIAISLDKDPETFKRYVASRHGSLPFTPIVWNQKGVLHKELARFGIKPGNGIPFTALMDEYGYVHQQGVIKPRHTKSYILDGEKKSSSAAVEQL